nr:hypothetical protein MANES_05G178800 [Ipomoea batatas]GMC50488.1 hypothetical protein MANES_05G178800 [Ipomoea batatas]
MKLALMAALVFVSWLVVSAESDAMLSVGENPKPTRGRVPHRRYSHRRQQQHKRRRQSSPSSSDAAFFPSKRTVPNASDPLHNRR